MDLLLYIFFGFIESVKFYLPAIVYNVAVYLHFSYVLKADLIPLDGGHSLGRQRVIGGGRGIEGFYVALLSGALVGTIAGDSLRGIYLAIGANVGCVLASFVKRRMGIERGTRFSPLDNVDFILGATALYSTRYLMDWQNLIFGLPGIAILHFLGNITFRPVWESYLSSSTRRSLNH